jgi:hypothetical protein
MYGTQHDLALRIEGVQQGITFAEHTGQSMMAQLLRGKLEILQELLTCMIVNKVGE